MCPIRPTRGSISCAGISAGSTVDDRRRKMAISDIPEYVEVTPGDLIRAENWNGMQQQMRDSLRRHQHTRPPGAPVDDAAANDVSDQIGTDEIADGAVTGAKLA